MELVRYWIKFDISLSDSPPVGILSGCGITARNYDDAITIISKSIFKDRDMPNIKECIENVDISSLDANHVLPNMGSPFKRGIWFPLGYS